MRLGTAYLLFTVVALGGCARSTSGPALPLPTALGEGSPFLIPTLATGDAWLRHHLMLGQAHKALELFESSSDRLTSDALLRALQQSIIHREAGEFERSNDLLEWADREAEKRRIRSATRTAASFLISDRVLSYTPTTTEAAMIPYYRMMNYLDLGEIDEAAVEARRISAILGRGEAGQVRRCRGDGLLYYLSGLVFEAAGEVNDALVSIRRAEEGYAVCGAAGDVSAPVGLGRDLVRLASAVGLTELADSARLRYPDTAGSAGDSAEIVLVVERGFIAHRAEQAVHVPIFDDDIDGLESGNEDGIEALAAEVARRLSGEPVIRYGRGPHLEGDSRYQVAQAFAGAYVLRLVWPGIIDPPDSGPRPRARVAGRSADPGRVADLTALAHSEFEAERTSILTRLAARSLTKYLISREVEKKAEKEGGELLGFIAGRLMNLAANETERADTRSWTLLPEEISIARVTVAPGEVPVGIELGDSAASPPSGREFRRITVRPGERKLLGIRVFDGRAEPGVNAQKGSGLAESPGG